MMNPSKRTPVVSIQAKINDFRLQLDILDEIVFIAGDSGVGKSFLYEQLSLLSTEKEFNFIKCFNYLSPDLETQVEYASKNADNLIVIDNFETLWSKKLANTIMASPAKFALISRDFFGLMTSKYGVAELEVADGLIALRYPLAWEIEDE